MVRVGDCENQKLVVRSEDNRIRIEDFRHGAAVVGDTKLQRTATRVQARAL